MGCPGIRPHKSMFPALIEEEAVESPRARNAGDTYRESLIAELLVAARRNSTADLADLVHAAKWFSRDPPHPEPASLRFVREPAQTP